MKQAALDVVALAGLGVLLFGVHQIYVPAALILGGLALSLVAVGLAKRAS